MNGRIHRHEDHPGKPSLRQPKTTVASGLSRPFTKGSSFGFDATGCIFRPRDVFRALMRGDLSRQEIYAIGVHKMKCWKCNETFAALRLEADENMIQEVIESEPHLADVLDDDEEEPAFRRQLLSDASGYPFRFAVCLRSLAALLPEAACFLAPCERRKLLKIMVHSSVLAPLVS